jgi:hypothetical protein
MPAPNTPRPPTLADTPLTVRYGLPYLPSDVAGRQAIGQPARYAVGPFAQGLCTSQWPHCAGVVSGDTGLGHDVPTGSATIDDSSYLWGLGFETLAPGPGVIGAKVLVGWDVPSPGLLDCYVQFDDDTSAPITWV